METEEKSANKDDHHRHSAISNRLSNDRWRNRRRMAWVALWAIMIVTYFALFSVPVERLNVLKEVITWFYFVMGSVVGAYVGFATLDDIQTRKPK